MVRQGTGLTSPGSRPVPVIKTFNAQSLKQTGTGDSMIYSCSDENDYHKAEKSWRSAFIPEEEFILNRAKKHIFYVVWTGKQGVLTWPAVRISDCYITVDMTVPMLMVEHIYDLSEYEVVPHEAVSPLFLYLEGKINSESFGIVLKHSHPVPLLEFNAKMGFPNIEEEDLRYLAEDLGVL